MTINLLINRYSEEVIELKQFKLEKPLKKSCLKKLKFMKVHFSS